MKQGKYILPFLFAVFILLPSINQWFNFWEFEEKDENRNKITSVEFNISKLDNFPEEYEAYYNDNFSFRAWAIDLFADLKKDLFKSNSNELMILSEDNFVFNRSLSRFTIGEDFFYLDEAIDLELLWEERKQFFGQLGIESYWFVIPCKSDVYERKLPWSFNHKQRRPIGEYLSQYQGFNNVHYLLDHLKQESFHKQVYYKSDTHWNLNGAEVGYQTIIKELSKKYPGIKEFPLNQCIVDTFQQKGNSLVFIPIEDFYEPLSLQKPTEGYVVYGDKFDLKMDPKFSYPEAFQYHLFSRWEKALDLKVLIIRDSFTIFFTERLASNFKETLFLWDNWQYGLNEDAIKKFQPDLILYITINYTLKNMLPQVQEDEDKEWPLSD